MLHKQKHRYKEADGTVERMHDMGKERLPKTAWEAVWANMATQRVD